MQAAERLALVREGKLVLGSDMDGTMTDPEQMNDLFSHLFAQKIAELIGMNVAECQLAIETSKQIIRLHPQDHNWIVNQQAVAPGISDYILLNQVAAHRWLHDSLHQPEDVDGILGQAFLYAHEQTPVRFRPGAAEFVQYAQERGKVVFVTNSRTTQVEQRLQVLLPGNTIPVLGDAKKMIVDPAFQEFKDLPPSVERPGYDRPIDLRRPHYYHTLTQRIPQQFGVEGGMMLGDIPELDLMLPEYLGWWTVLLTSSFTPSWEQRYYTSLATGFRAGTLLEVLEWLHA